MGQWILLTKPLKYCRFCPLLNTSTATTLIQSTMIPCWLIVISSQVASQFPFLKQNLCLLHTKARMIPLKAQSILCLKPPSRCLISFRVKDKVLTMSYTTYKTWLPIIFWPVIHSSLHSSPAPRTSLLFLTDMFPFASPCFIMSIYLSTLMKIEIFICFVHNFISSVPRNVSGTQQVFSSYLLLDTNLTVPLCHAALSHFSHVRLFVTPWTVAHQSSLSMGFFRQKYWTGLPYPTPRDLPDPGIECTSLMSPTLTAVSLTLASPGRPNDSL